MKATSPTWSKIAYWHRAATIPGSTTVAVHSAKKTLTKQHQLQVKEIEKQLDSLRKQQEQQSYFKLESE